MSLRFSLPSSVSITGCFVPSRSQACLDPQLKQNSPSGAPRRVCTRQKSFGADRAADSAAAAAAWLAAAASVAACLAASAATSLLMVAAAADAAADVEVAEVDVETDDDAVLVGGRC